MTFNLMLSSIMLRYARTQNSAACFTCKGVSAKTNMNCLYTFSPFTHTTIRPQP